ncbi:LysR family transcription regulator (plasmid) [Zymomonas mobilis subsp. mobilis ZM4 = ATCC 31821]|uniref:LysR family transcriptional regulator n=1 Tax=Zymomonas mobilis TaxID=542 RepID=UPI0007851154|nr:LysR family transcriptional regulator [Zymomonas mobilis]AVZ26837.1 LysR family transcription regulator [Zymomonas mobilis subsp. mobilis]AVZ28723.1 LysR family transcription regulator [Zymomonas mobilis subsp. mobilis]AVZ43169.1 LysR family transcription regulator [Zymomonas mobilis subsp. mobilis ZM4 = ATCC 31821]UBQ08755.1 LysR family transcriptional regulator [Zymomonas mobilis]
MRREELVDLNAFVVIAEEQSFTRAAAKLGTSQSTLSYTIRRLESRLNVRLLARTTRRVAPTEAGERLLTTLVPALNTISSEIALLSELSEKPSGTVRITTSEHAAETILWPALCKFLPNYPDLHVELSVDGGLTDIVAERFDAGVRLEETIARDMIAVPIGPPLRMAVVAAPSYFTDYPVPSTPQDLSQHLCINLRLPTAGGVYAWELERGRRAIRVRVEGQLTFNSVPMIRQAALDGFGLACIMEDQIMSYLENGRLIRVLEDWCPPFPGYHLYYPSRRQPSAAFRLIVRALRYRG